MALLSGLAELVAAGRLLLKVVVAHFDHGLRAESASDAVWVGELARKFDFEYISERTDIRSFVTAAPENLEQAARQLRYGFLRSAAVTANAGMVLTAHTLDDQAETVLMRLVRGAGVDGLAGIAQIRPIENESGTLLVRPLLNWARRSTTEDYCRERGIAFLWDSMNEDEGYARVRIRKRVIPLLEELNPRAVENIARATTLFRDDVAALQNEAELLLQKATIGWNSGNSTQTDPFESQSVNHLIKVSVLVGAPAALRRRALRLWLAQVRGNLRRIERVHLLAVDRLLDSGRGGRLAELPGGARVERRRGFLMFQDPKTIEKDRVEV